MTGSKNGTRLLFAALICVGAIVLAGCGSSSSDSSSTGGGESTGASASTGSGEGGSSGLSAATKNVEELRKPITTFTPPGPALESGAIESAGLAGKAIWYIPISASVPIFAGEKLGIEEATSELGMKFNICDGKFLPSAAAACISQAVNAGAAAIVLESIDPSVVGPAMAQAKSAGVPVIAEGNEGETTADVAYISAGQPQEQRAAMNWIVADSKGKANILATTVIGTKTGEVAAAAGVEELEANCPGCEYEAVEITDAQQPKIQSLVATALTRNTGAEYGFPEFDFFAAGFEAAVRQAGRTDMKLVSTDAELSRMQEIASGGLQVVEAGANRNYLGWRDVDTALRMALGETLASEEFIPIRIFDETNIGELKLTSAAESSGEWWGSDIYKKEFAQLWSVG